ncbi:hypothetical protein [Nitrosomonas sp. sh817]|uniref:hypothetical protein n=1 Tax=Nitrosomonas sp. sh817 TaxID=3070658 RepID=UPI0027DD14A8|nr:hypothetical protein [Nitrosomonas sp. sh817]WMJ09972.1 hypothetical protein RBH92_07165 [Nitrosomonas sp. sh817]
MEDSKSFDPYKQTNIRYQLYREARAMAEYALANGKTVPETVIRTIDAFAIQDDQVLNDRINVRSDLDIGELLVAHCTLAKIVEPAKPKTILLLDIEQGVTGFMKFLGPVSLIRQMMIAAVVSLILFIGLSLTEEVSHDSGNIMVQDGYELLLNLMFYLSAAGLGASFAALYKANTYIANGTFDPTYHASYWIQFFLGLIAGLILAIMVSEAYFSKHLSETPFLEKGIIRPLLAMLGGFSADLTHTVLSRLVETIRSLFTGSPRDQMANKKKALQNDFAAQHNQEKMHMASNLVTLQQIINSGATAEELNQKIDLILKDTLPATEIQRKPIGEE